MPEISDETLSFAIECLEANVHGFYDDPVSWAETDEAQGLREQLDQLRRIAEDLGLDFDAVVAQETTEVERARVDSLIAGTVEPTG